MLSEEPASKILSLTAQIVSAHISNNPLGTEALPQLIQAVYQSLAGAGSPSTPDPATQAPAVPIKKSVFPDHIVCLEDGMSVKMLKRHLQSRHGMTPNEYRAKWGLPASYPMVAVEYAGRRSELAKTIGLGRKKDQAEGSEATVTKAPARRARGSKG
jgi:predicted transcriptional regulator